MIVPLVCKMICLWVHYVTVISDNDYQITKKHHASLSVSVHVLLLSIELTKSVRFIATLIFSLPPKLWLLLFKYVTLYIVLKVTMK